MKQNPLILALLGLFSCFQLAAAARNEKVLLSKIKALTLRSGQPTTARRVSSIPQLKCVGGDAEGLYEIDVMRCTNLGSDYGEGEDVSWSCTADVPKFFKLGSTDVLCEGYASADDPYILKGIYLSILSILRRSNEIGSCGVEYRLALTDAGYEKYGSSLNRAITGEGILYSPYRFAAETLTLPRRMAGSFRNNLLCHRSHHPLLRLHRRKQPRPGPKTQSNGRRGQRSSLVRRRRRR